MVSESHAEHFKLVDFTCNVRKSKSCTIMNMLFAFWGLRINVKCIIVVDYWVLFLCSLKWASALHMMHDAMHLMNILFLIKWTDWTTHHAELRMHPNEQKVRSPFVLTYVTWTIYIFSLPLSLLIISPNMKYLNFGIFQKLICQKHWNACCLKGIVSIAFASSKTTTNTVHQIFACDFNVDQMLVSQQNPFFSWIHLDNRKYSILFHLNWKSFAIRHFDLRF